MRITTTIAALMLSVTVHASTWTSEITDMWWAPDQPGWGVNIILQHDTAYATFFLYDHAGTPTWYTAVLKFEKATTSGNFLWSGPLYETRGAWYGGPYAPGSIRPAGNASFELPYLGQATLSYTIDGVEVLRIVNRQTWKTENVSGNYMGGFSYRTSSCVPSSLDDLKHVAVEISVDHSDSNFSARTIDVADDVCTFGGKYSQLGKLGEVIGAYSCTDGNRGVFHMYEMSANVTGFTARVDGENKYCKWSGFLGGTRQMW